MGDNLNDEGKARITRRKLLAATGATAASAAWSGISHTEYIEAVKA